MKFLIKLGISSLATLVALIPFWIFLGIKAVASPEGFWQNTVLLGIGVYFLGGIQFFLLALLAIYLSFLWFGDPRSVR